MNPGVYLNVPNEVYQAGPGLSVTGVKEFRRTPYHFRRRRIPGAPLRPPTPAMLNGTLVHCALLEPHAFDKRYVIAPDMSKNSNAYREWVASVGAKGLTPIDAHQRAAAFEQAASLRGLEDVAPLLSDGDAEVSAYWLDEETGVLCRCRPDFVASVEYGTGVILIDVKTTTDASAAEFARSCGRWGYHLQADWYCTGYARASGLTVHGMVFAVVESEYPYAAASFMLGDNSLIRAYRANRDAVARYAKCLADDEWPAYPAGIQVIDVPVYY